MRQQGKGSVQSPLRGGNETIAQASRQLDVVTIAFMPEIRLLQLQARSLDRFLTPDAVSRIWVINNDPQPKRFERAFNKVVLGDYGLFREKVTLLNPRSLARSLGRPLGQSLGRSLGGSLGQRTARHGWWSQQYLKIRAAGFVSQPQYLLLDAKNHFFRPVTASRFFADDGRLITHRYRIIDQYRRYFERACRLFGVSDPDRRLDGALPTATPFLVHTDEMLAMTTALEAVIGCPLTVRTYRALNLLEFYLYYAFLLGRYDTVEDHYVTGPRATVTAFHRFPAPGEDERMVLSWIEEPDLYCLGLHRRRLETRDGTILDRFADIWRDAGLVDGAEEVRYFQSVPPVRTSRAGSFFGWCPRLFR